MIQYARVPLSNGLFVHVYLCTKNFFNDLKIRTKINNIVMVAWVLKVVEEHICRVRISL